MNNKDKDKDNDKDQVKNKDNDNKNSENTSSERQDTTNGQASPQLNPPQFQGPRPGPLLQALLQPAAPPAPSPFDICDLLNGLEKAEELFDTLVSDDSPDCPEDEAPQVKKTEQKDSLTGEDLSAALGSTATLLRNINEIRNQLVNLNIETFGNNFFDNMVEPFLVTIRDLASTSANLSASAEFLSRNIIEETKIHKVKDTIDLIYDLNEKAEDVFKVLRRRVNTLIRIGKLEDKKEFEGRRFIIKRR